MTGVIGDDEACYRAVQSRDPRFDGWFFTAVVTTGIYCRPSCPATTPRQRNVRFFPTAAAAQQAGFRACRRCRPDASPGSPEWRHRSDLVARAVRLVADGVVDREGVSGLARRLGYGERHVHRALRDELGAGPLALARAQRAHTARLLVETTDLPFTQVAFAAGFDSVRQFNDTVRDVFATTPTDLRRTRRHAGTSAPGTLTLRLPFRAPGDVAGTLAFLGVRAVPGVEAWDGATYCRSLRLPHGAGVVALADGGSHVGCMLRLTDQRDLAAAVARCRRLLDLDADPVAVAAVLGDDAVLAPLVADRPGRRVPGAVDGAELAVRAVLGQQVSVAGARTAAARLVAHADDRLDVPDGSITHRFPTPAAVADAAAGLAGPAARRRTLVAVAHALAGGLELDPGADRAEALAALAALPGIGPWTLGYVALRALNDPDVFLPTDLGVRRALEARGALASPRASSSLAERWRPWRSYAVLHLWAMLNPKTRTAKTPATSSPAASSPATKEPR